MMPMTIEVAKYQFQAWARKESRRTSTSRTHSAIRPRCCRQTNVLRYRSALSINATPQTPKNFALVGTGRHHRHSSRHDRSHRTSELDHECRTELLAFIEFYDEDFPWRYHAGEATERSSSSLDILLVLNGTSLPRRQAACRSL